MTFLEGRKKDHGYLRISEIQSDTPKGNLPNKNKSYRHISVVGVFLAFF
jgi:hypothetical protein